MSLYHELKRRNVFRVAIAYLAGSWLLVEVAETIFPLFGFDDTPARILVIVLAIGFPMFLLFSWVFEFTPEGLKKEKDIDRIASVTHKTGKQLDRIIIVLLALALGYFAFDKFVLEPARVSDLVEETAQQARSKTLVESYGDQSIAVLPFINMSDDAGNEYFSDGISEELLNLLAQIPELRVISRSSSFSFKGKGIAIPEVAKQLNVAHVLEGSVRKAGNRVRITAQLIDARSDTHLWSETYDRDLDDIFALQDEIAAMISDSLKVKLALVDGKAVSPTAIKAANADAYDAYLRGRELIHNRDKESLQDAVRFLERSLSLDDDYAPAHAQLAIATILLVIWDTVTLEEAKQKAIPHLDRAQQVEPGLAQAHGGRALLAFYAKDLESAIEHARKALELDPSYSDAMNWLYVSFEALGRYGEAEAVIRQSLLTDPLYMAGRYNYTQLLARKGRLDEAHELADQLMEQYQSLGYRAHAEMSCRYEGNFTACLYWGLKVAAEFELGGRNLFFKIALMIVGEHDEARRVLKFLNYYVDALEGHWDEAIRSSQMRMKIDPDTAGYLVGVADVFYYAGRIDEALPLYEQALDMMPEDRPFDSWSSLSQMMQMAFARRKAGDEEGAQAVAQIARQDYAARHAVGEKNNDQYRAAARIAAFDNQSDLVIPALQSAIEHGLWETSIFDDPIFEHFWGDPRFVVLQKELDRKLAVEREKVLQLICFNNPVPDDWQPLPETCEGVAEQHGL